MSENTAVAPPARGPRKHRYKGKVRNIHHGGHDWEVTLSEDGIRVRRKHCAYKGSLHLRFDRVINLAQREPELFPGAALGRAAK